MTDNEQIIKITKTIMILTGFWKRPLNVSPLKKKLYVVYVLMVRIAYVVFWVSLLVEKIRLAIQKYETEIIMSNISVLVTATKIQIKLIIFIKNNISELYDIPIQKEQEIWRSNDEEIKKVYSKKVKVCTYFMATQTLSSLFAVAGLYITGFIANAKVIQHNRLYNTTVETYFMYYIYFPVNKLDNLTSYYSVMLVYGWASFLFNSITHMLIINLLIFGAAQLEVLQIKLKKFVTTDGKSGTNSRVLKQLILEHISIIEFITTVNHRTINIVMLEFISSSIDVATVAMNFSTNSDVGWWAMFFILLSVQIFSLTWNANEIQEQSLAVADEIYKSDWYLLDKEASQLTHIIMMRAQRPLTVTIGLFGAITTRSALVIYKAAYSYVSVMK